MCLGSSVGRVLTRWGHVVMFGGSVLVDARAASNKGTLSSVPAWFRADSGTEFLN